MKNQYLYTMNLSLLFSININNDGGAFTTSIKPALKIRKIGFSFKFFQLKLFKNIKYGYLNELC